MQQRTILFLIVVVLLSIGIVMIYSTSAIFAEERYNDSYFFLKRQALWIVLGLGGFSLAVNVDYHRLRSCATLFLCLSVGLLLMVFLPGVGRAAGGASRWIRIAGISFQPSEMAKPTLVIYIADTLTKKQRQIQQ